MLQNTTRMLRTHPNPPTLFDTEALAECIAACFDCAQVTPVWASTST